MGISNAEYFEPVKVCEHIRTYQRKHMGIVNTTESGEPSSLKKPLAHIGLSSGS